MHRGVLNGAKVIDIVGNLQQPCPAIELNSVAFDRKVHDKPTSNPKCTRSLDDAADQFK
jgi:hypothetical protein